MTKWLKVLLKKLGAAYIYNKYLAIKSFINRFFKGLSYYIYNSFFTNFPSYKVRKLYLQKVIGIEIGKYTSIHMGCFFAGNHIRIGNNCVIARKCYLDGRIGLIEIRDNVSIAPECAIISMSHSVSSPTFDIVVKPVVLHDYVWLGTRSMIMPGVIAHEGSVVAAGAVATKDIEAYSVVGGCPAKNIGKRTTNLNYTLKYFPFFNSDIQ